VKINRHILRLKNNKHWLWFFLVLMIIVSLFKLSTIDSNNTHVEKMIKKYNGLKDFSSNPRHPTVSEPANSQIGVVGLDSVRVIPSK